jgi:hypothetical protein
LQTKIANMEKERAQQTRNAEEAKAKAEQMAEAYKANAQQARSSLQSMVEPLLGKTQVSGEDLAAAAMGNYVDKVDENRRRLEAIKLAPSLDHELIAKLPADMQNELKAAFATGGAGGMQDAISQMLNANAGLGDFRLYNADMIADQIANQLAEAAAKKDLMAVVMQKLQAKGIDPNSAFVQRALGISAPEGATTNMPQAAMMTSQFAMQGAGDARTQGASPFAPVADSFSQALQSVQPSTALMTAIANDAEGLQKVGTEAGQKFGMAFVSSLSDTDFGFGAKLLKTLQTYFDGRYMRLFSGLSE